MRIWCFDWDGVIENTKGMRNPQWLKQFFIERYLAGDKIFIVTFQQRNKYNEAKVTAKLQKLLESEDKESKTTLKYTDIVNGISFANDPKLDSGIAQHDFKLFDKKFDGKNTLIKHSLTKANITIPVDLKDIILVDDSLPNCEFARTAGYQTVEVDPFNNSYIKSLATLVAGPVNTQETVATCTAMPCVIL